MLLAGRQLHLLVMVQFSSYRKWLHFVIVCAVFIASWTWRDMGYVWQVPLSELCQWISLSLLKVIIIIIMLCYFSAVLSCQTLLPLFNLSLPPSLLLSLSLSLSHSLSLSLSLALSHSLTCSATSEAGVLDRGPCLAALAALRHTTWFKVCTLAHTTPH